MSAYSEIFTQTWAMILVVVFFGGSIFVHELGHFLAAKWRGLRVERFSIGFGPKIFEWKGKDGCRYRVSLLPLGGYVALPELADMGALEGGSPSNKSSKTLSYFDKFSVSFAGALFNLFLATLLAAIVWLLGVPVSATFNTTQIGNVSEKIYTISGEEIENPAFKAGLKAGDKVLAIDGRGVKQFSDIMEFVAIGSGRDAEGKPESLFKIERDGKVLEIKVSPKLMQTNLQTGDALRILPIEPATKLKIARVVKNSPAALGGLKVNDEIVGVNGSRVYSNIQIVKHLQKLSDNEGMTLDILRGEVRQALQIVPRQIFVTKPLCEIELPDGAGKIEFVLQTTESSDSKNPNSVDTLGNVIIYRISSKSHLLSGLNIGDRVLQIASKDISTIMQLDTLILKALQTDSCKLDLMSPDGNLKYVILPKGTSSKIIPARESRMIGYEIKDEIIVEHPNIPTQFWTAAVRTYDALFSLLNPQSDVGIKHLAGPVDIVRIMHRLSFLHISKILSFVVLLNINLAILNLLPIPVLDGGHIMFATIAKILGRPIPQKIISGIQGVFVILFMSFMLYIFTFGFLRWAGDIEQQNNQVFESEYIIDNSKLFKDE